MGPEVCKALNMKTGDLGDEMPCICIHGLCNSTVSSSDCIDLDGE